MSKYITHKEYIASPYWKRFSKKLLDDPDVECAMCHRKKWAFYRKNVGKKKVGDKRRLIVLNLHHVDYDNLGVGDDHVLTLCRRCHLLSHDIEKASRSGSFWKDVYESLLHHSTWQYEKAEKFEVPDNFILPKKRKKK